MLDVKSIIQFGTRLPENYLILFLKQIYNTEVNVRIRGLSNYEYDMISMEMYREVNDAATIKYIFNPTNEDTGKKLTESKEESKEELDKEVPPDVNIIALTKAYILRNVLIVFYAMKDFYKGLTVDQVKQMEGIDEIADRVNTKSGRTKEIMEKIHFFRGSQRESNSTIPVKEGTQTQSGN